MRVIPAETIKQAKLTPPGARVRQDASLRDARAVLHAELVRRWPGEVESNHCMPGEVVVDFALPKQAIMIAFDRWGIERERLDAYAAEHDLTLIHCTYAALASPKDRKGALEWAMVLIGRAYAIQEAEHGP